MAPLQSTLATLCTVTTEIAGTSCQFTRWSNRRQLADRRASSRREWRIRAEADEEAGGAGGGGGGDDADFEARLAQMIGKGTSGSGKKAELRKARKAGGADAVKTKTKDSIFIPPVALREPASSGLKVELGLTPYTERLHGRLAALGLAAVLLVELATGDSFIKFHESGTLFVQVYSILGLAILFVKFEKEKISVWPKS